MKRRILLFTLIIGVIGFLTGEAFSQTHPVDGEYIKEWLVLGPFFDADLEKDFLAPVGGEANIAPKEGDTVTTADGKTLTWKRYQAKGNIVDLLDPTRENAIVYAFCLLQSETDGEAQIHLGYSRRGIAVWINGKQIHQNSIGAPLDTDVFEVNLKAGVNRCLVKIPQFGKEMFFAMRILMLPKNRAVISGVVTDEQRQPIPHAEVHLEEDDLKVAETQTDTAGRYHLNLHPVRGTYDLSATEGNRGTWQFSLRLREGERRTLNLTLKEAISIEGTLLMLDDTTPLMAVPVQAIRIDESSIDNRQLTIDNSEVVATTLSDESGKYRFINLKPGRYQVRCYTSRVVYPFDKLG